MQIKTAPSLQSGNHLIDALPPDEKKRLLSYSKSVVLEAEQPLYEVEDAISSIYFPLNSVVSYCSLMEDGSSAEVCLTGREGVVGVQAIFGEKTARSWTGVLTAGAALKMDTNVMRDVVSTNDKLRSLLLGFYGHLMRQVSQRAVCSGRHSLLQRFCFWLLLVNELAGNDEIPLTHEIIARKLGARRAGVTNVAGTMQEKGAISYARGTIHVHDRKLLESEACECFHALKMLD
jgi:CRP-like cAMP-binding protein